MSLVNGTSKTWHTSTPAARGSQPMPRDRPRWLRWQDRHRQMEPPDNSLHCAFRGVFSFWGKLLVWITYYYYGISNFEIIWYSQCSNCFKLFLTISAKDQWSEEGMKGWSLLKGEKKHTFCEMFKQEWAQLKWARRAVKWDHPSQTFFFCCRALYFAAFFPVFWFHTTLISSPSLGAFQQNQWWCPWSDWSGAPVLADTKLLEQKLTYFWKSDLLEANLQSSAIIPSAMNQSRGPQ